MTTDNFYFYLRNRLIQTSQTGGQWYSDTSPFSIPCSSFLAQSVDDEKSFIGSDTLKPLPLFLRRRWTVADAFPVSDSSETSTSGQDFLSSDRIPAKDRSFLSG